MTVGEGAIPERSDPERGVGAFLVRLSMDPGESVEARISWMSGDTDIDVYIGSTLLFDSSNYFVWQPVILSAAEDVDWVEGQAIIMVTAPGIPAASVTAFEEENEPIPPIVYVDETAMGDGTGTGWADAFVELRDALVAIHNPARQQRSLGCGGHVYSGAAGRQP